MKDDVLAVLFKFSETKWAHEILKWNISYSCAENFINQANRTDNDIQGDRYEAVFARYRCNNPEIIEKYWIFLLKVGFMGVHLELKMLVWYNER